MSNFAKALADMEKMANNLSKSMTDEEIAKEAKKEGETFEQEEIEEKAVEAKKKKEKEISKSLEASEATKDTDAEEANGDLKVKKDCIKAEAEDDDEETIEKSLKTNEEASNALEVSTFLAELTKSISDSVKGFSDNLQKSMDTNEGTLEVFAKSFGAIAQTQAKIAEAQGDLTQLVKSIGGKLEAVETKIEGIEMSPNMRKSVRDVNVFDKNFKKSISDATNTNSKSDNLRIMNDLLVKGDTVMPMDIISYESGSPLRPEVVERIQAVSDR